MNSELLTDKYRPATSEFHIPGRVIVTIHNYENVKIKN